ncbi:MAG: hypothetical protein A2X29_10490 [Elusimicrobia bacterium GWA2_64_40]|nr:MAG: hypothetical protein A2X29_10490 [Elusimicrobia bacterium GWA2_64_40]OGR67904.1 MAG: hypothetical protein A2X30_02915 [Elusimicrobia bacterium GWB2_63_16]
MKFRIAAVTALLAAGAAFAAAEEVKINTTEINGRLVDDTNLPFVNDPAVLGEWRSVDFVREPGRFVPGKKQFGGSLFLEGLTFLPEGRTAVPWFGWTRGVVMHLGGDHTASRYSIKELNGAVYMFFEWKSGDYIIRRKKPQYYVLKKVVPGAGPGGLAPTLIRTEKN